MSELNEAERFWQKPNKEQQEYKELAFEQAQAAINTICEALLSDDVVSVASHAVRAIDGCGYVIHNEVVFCDDQRLPKYLVAKNGNECSCKEQAKSALTAAVKKIKGDSYDA